MEEKDVQRLLDMLYSMIDEAKSAAFSSDKCVISRDEALDLLDDIRAKLPLEIKKAQELVRAREEYVSSAKKEVEKMLRQAELDAKTKVSDSEVLYAAKEKAQQKRKAQEFRDHSSGRGTQQGAVPRGQHLHRGRSAPDGGGHSGGAGRGEGVPCPVPGHLQRADAGQSGEAAGAETRLGATPER